MHVFSTKWGFTLTPSELYDNVQECATAKKEDDSGASEYLRKYCRFKVDKPGQDWV